MKAFLLAAGLGTRLLPYTSNKPKCLIEIGGKPLLLWTIERLKASGINDLVINLFYKGSQIENFFGDGSKWGLKIDYSLENKALSTMAPLKLIDYLPNDCLVMNGDVLTDLNFRDFYTKHVESKNIFSISSYQREVKSEFGVLDVNSDGNLIGFREKPVSVFDVSMGIYMVSKKSIDYIPQNTFYGFDHLMMDLMKNKEKPKVYKFDGYWLDIGRPDDYSQAMDEFNEMKTKFI